MQKEGKKAQDYRMGLLTSGPEDWQQMKCGYQAGEARPAAHMRHLHSLWSQLLHSFLLGLELRISGSLVLFDFDAHRWSPWTHAETLTGLQLQLTRIRCQVPSRARARGL